MATAGAEFRWMEAMTMRDDPGGGMQSLERAVSVLRAVGDAGPGGARLAEVAAATGLSRSTAHRFLLALAQTGLLEQDASAGQFHLGLELCTLGAVAANRYELRDVARPVMQRLADRTGDTVYLSLRDGHEAVCVERVEGGFPIRTLTLEVGDRRPLGVGAGSLALLAFQSDDLVATGIAANADRLGRFSRLDAAGLSALVARTRGDGYAFNDQQVIPGMSALGVPLLDAKGVAVAALSIAAISDRLAGERREQLLAWLRDDAAALGHDIAKLTGPLSEHGLRTLARRRRAG